jgi:hypothetical protein
MKLTLLTVFCIAVQPALGQLTLNQNTEWKVSGNVYTVLSDIDFHSDAGLEMNNGLFKFTGKADNSITGSQKLVFYAMEVDKQNPRKITLTRDISVSSSLVFTSGLLDLGNANVELILDGHLKGESESSRIVSSGNGQIFKTILLNAPNAADPGDLGISITSSQNLGSTTIRRGHQSQTNGSGTGNSIFRYYDIVPANNITLDATLRFEYLDAELNGLAENTLVLWKSADNSNWTNEGYTNRDMAANYVEKTGITGFSRWTLSSVGNALPVTGLKLSGRWHNDLVQLNWITLTENNNRHFYIERKYSTETAFTVVGIQNSLHPGGNSQVPSNYQWSDPAAADKGIIYYRLKQVDFDGAFTYSNIITIRPEVSKGFIEKLFPTFGVGQSIYIQTGSLGLQKMMISIVDIKGQVVARKQLPYASQWFQLPALVAGTYLVSIESGEQRYQSAFIKQ